MSRYSLPIFLLFSGMTLAQSGGTPAVSARGSQSAAAEVTLEAPQPQQNAGAQSGTQQSVPLPKPAPGTPQKRSGTQITLDQAIQLAIDNSPTLKASRTQIEQNQAQEITANLRPNPTLSWDTQFVPIFTPSLFSSETLQNLQQFDVGIGYTFERGQKRQHRLQAARDATAVTEAQVADTVRTLSFNVAQQFVNVLLAQANIDLSQADLDSFQQTVTISQERYRAGDISEGDLLKIKLQLLQFQTDLSSAQVAKLQALASLRVLMGFNAVPHDYDVAGQLTYEPLASKLDDLDAAALRQRADLRAAQQGVRAAQSQMALAYANGKQDLGTEFSYSHVSGFSGSSLFFNIPLPIFDRNQGEKARTRYALDQAQFTSQAAEQTVHTDVSSAYDAAQTDEEIVKLYLSGYLKQAQDSREISEYAYRGGAATLLDLLDAERSYRSTQLGYRQAVASYMLALEQLREAVGSRSLP